MASETERSEFPYPRRRIIRAVLKRMADMAMNVMTDLEVFGQENLPEKGPLLLVANHFSPVDPVAMIRAAPWQPEFVGGFQMPNAPALLTWIPAMWGYYPVHRGTASRYALRAAQKVLSQDGILGIFPEAGSRPRCCARHVPELPSWPPRQAHPSCPWGSEAWRPSCLAWARD